MSRMLNLRFLMVTLLAILCCCSGPVWSAENFLDTVGSAGKLQGVSIDKPAKPAADSGDPFGIFDDEIKFAKKTATATNPIESWRQKIAAKFGIKAMDSKTAKWTAAQLEKLYGILEKLPASYRSHTKVIVRDKMYKSKYVLGYVKKGVPTVHLLNAGCVSSQFTDTIVHEMMHVFLFKQKQKVYSWADKFWPNGANAKPIPPSVTSYGNTNPEEDLCESVAFYFSKAKSMKKAQSARYEWIKKNVFFGKEF